MVDYRKFRFSKLKTPEFSHLWLLLFWPIYFVIFTFLERGLPWVAGLLGHEITYYPIWCPLDEWIPFCEWFIIPYYIWFAFLAGMLLYSLLFEVPLFKKYMWFIIITYSITCLIYIFFPNMQELRPTASEIGRDNILVDIAFLLYDFDTNTNVCPSLHVIGSFAVFFASCHSKRLGKWYWLIPIGILTVLISLSTVFLKQHSIIDVLAGIVVCAVVYPLVYFWKPRKKKSDCQKESAERETEKAEI